MTNPATNVTLLVERRTIHLLVITATTEASFASNAFATTFTPTTFAPTIVAALAHCFQVAILAADIALLVFHWAIHLLVITAAAEASLPSALAAATTLAGTIVALTHRLQMAILATDVALLVFHRAIHLHMIISATAVASFAATTLAAAALALSLAHRLQVAVLATDITLLVGLRTIGFLVACCTAAVAYLLTRAILRDVTTLATIVAHLGAAIIWATSAFALVGLAIFGVIGKGFVHFCWSKTTTSYRL